MEGSDHHSVSPFRQNSRERLIGDERMSRRRVSVKDLGPVDCEGWLYRKREGKAFLGIKWRKYWFALKRTSLYWYASHMAEKAEGYINLSEFTIEPAVECKRKHAMKAFHPQIMTFYFAAESQAEMSRWLDKLKIMLTQNEPLERSFRGCYSEASDDEEAELTDPFSSAVEPNTPSVSPEPRSSCPSPNETGDPGPSPVNGVCASQNSSANESQSWLEISSSENAETVVCPSQGVGELPLQADSETCSDVDSQNPPSSPDAPVTPLSRSHHRGQGSLISSENQDVSPDEMEQLYIHLKQASLSPTGEHKPSTEKDFRSSFIKRCKNPAVNEKLHHVRALTSTLKAKEADLRTIEQLLADPDLSALRYRRWKEVNAALLQEICQRRGQGRGPCGEGEGAERAPHTVLYTETSM